MRNPRCPGFPRAAVLRHDHGTQLRHDHAGRKHAAKRSTAGRGIRARLRDSPMIPPALGRGHSSIAGASSRVMATPCRPAGDRAAVDGDLLAGASERLPRGRRRRGVAMTRLDGPAIEECHARARRDHRRIRSRARFPAQLSEPLRRMFPAGVVVAELRSVVGVEALLPGKSGQRGFRIQAPPRIRRRAHLCPSRP